MGLVSTVAATTTRAPRTRRPTKRLLLAMAIAALLAAGAAFAGVKLLGGHATPLPPAGTPAVISQDAVKDVARAAGHDVYGIPAPAGTRIEVTRGTHGEVWLRYLTGTAQAGDKRASFLTVGTYRQANAFTAAQAAAKGGDQRSAALPGGGIMLWSLQRPTSVYVARPGSDLLVEVYSPDAEQARALARSGAVTPLR
jgi:hypothetical protein